MKKTQAREREEIKGNKVERKGRINEVTEVRSYFEKKQGENLRRMKENVEMSGEIKIFRIRKWKGDRDQK